MKFRAWPNVFSSLIAALLGVGCATHHSITSEPAGATVYISPRGSQNSMALLWGEAPPPITDWKYVGETPVNVDLSKYAVSYINPTYQVELAGYLSQNFMLDRGMGKGHHFVLDRDPRAKIAPPPKVTAPVPAPVAKPVAPPAPPAAATLKAVATATPAAPPAPVVAAPVVTTPKALPPVSWTPENFAVADLIAYTLSANEVKTLSETLHAALAETRYFRILSRNDMAEVLKTQTYSRSEACDESQCLVQMGMLLSVGKIVGGSIGQVGRTYSLSLRLVDVETGESQITVSRKLKAEADELLQLVEDAARELALKYAEAQLVSPR